MDFGVTVAVLFASQLQKKARIVESAEVLDSLGEEFKKSDFSDKSGTLQTENMNDTLLAENVKLKHEVSHLKGLVTNLQTGMLVNVFHSDTSLAGSIIYLTSNMEFQIISICCTGIANFDHNT